MMRLRSARCWRKRLRGGAHGIDRAPRRGPRSRLRSIRMRRLDMRSAFLAIAAALALAACNSTGPTATAPPPKAASIVVAPSNFQMPAGAGCSGDIARYRAVQDDDLAMGQIAQSVYKQIRAEIDAAAQ